jgi:hypothetical protein
MHLFIELFTSKAEWLELTPEQRGEYLQRVGPNMQALLDEPGVEMIGVGWADPDTRHHAGYDVYSVWKLPDRASVRRLEQSIQDDGWYDYFEQVNVSGELEDMPTMMQRLATLA